MLTVTRTGEPAPDGHYHHPNRSNRCPNCNATYLHEATTYYRCLSMWRQDWPSDTWRFLSDKMCPLSLDAHEQGPRLFLSRHAEIC